MSGKQKQKKMSYRDRQAISYQQGADPPFLAQMKKQIGYKEYTVEDKFKDDEEQSGEEDPALDRDDIRNMTEEERPQIVVMDPKKDISSEELQKEIDKKREEEDKQKIMEGRITFRKPEKRPATDEGSDNNKKGDDKKQKRDQDEQQKPKQSVPVQQNKRLLSFGDEDEDDG